MATTRKQINVRASDETLARLDGLVQRVSDSMGVTLSQADVVQLALKELEKKYPSETGAEKPARKRK